MRNSRSIERIPAHLDPKGEGCQEKHSVWPERDESCTSRNVVFHYQGRQEPCRMLVGRREILRSGVVKLINNDILSILASVNVHEPIGVCLDPHPIRLSSQKHVVLGVITRNRGGPSEGPVQEPLCFVSDFSRSCRTCERWGDHFACSEFQWQGNCTRRNEGHGL